MTGLAAASGLPQTAPDYRTDYILKYKDAAISQMQSSGIPASITLAQACLESGFGTSRLAREGNNHFGIKCHDYKGRKMYVDDDVKDDCFRVYDRVEDSFQDHSDFLRFRSRYAFLFDLDPTDYKGWAYGLKAAGYATDPQYAVRLIDLIERYGLQQYDTVVSPDELPVTPVVAKLPEQVELKESSPLYKISLQREILKRNNVMFVVANGYESFYSIAREFNLFRWEVLRFNDERKDRLLQDGEVVYIEAKKKQADKYLDKHVVEEGESMRIISQQYAVKEKYLYKYNPGIPKGSDPAPGSIINLRKQ
ncbi:MAG: glucosaminidase domain-containing protein [Bacteroidales bacterium]|nr:glucosaminidase domain-containing protein [Bacteroidales bacterium]MBR3526386.1 glucosaminidase domain-containing protein [Bacteroidales bacterium]MCR5827155.1 glucosaminidase domain-containing protein [Bacteroidales bacterium]